MLQALIMKDERFSDYLMMLILCCFELFKSYIFDFINYIQVSHRGLNRTLNTWKILASWNQKPNLDLTKVITEYR